MVLPLNAHHFEQDFDIKQNQKLADAAQPITLIRTGLGNDYIVQALAIDHRHSFCIQPM